MIAAAPTIDDVIRFFAQLPGHTLKPREGKCPWLKTALEAITGAEEVKVRGEEDIVYGESERKVFVDDAINLFCQQEAIRAEQLITVRDAYVLAIEAKEADSIFKTSGTT